MARTEAEKDLAQAEEENPRGAILADEAAGFVRHAIRNAHGEEEVEGTTLDPITVDDRI